MTKPQLVFETPKSKRFAYENDIKEKWLQVTSAELLKFQRFYSISPKVVHINLF